MKDSFGTIPNELAIQMGLHLHLRIAADLGLVFESNTYSVLTTHLKALFEDLNLLDDLSVILLQWEIEKQRNEDYQRKDRKKSIDWMRRNLSRLRNTVAYQQYPECQRAIEEAYRYVSRTKYRLSIPGSKKAILVMNNEAWSGGFWNACWWKFRAACFLVASTGDFVALTKFSKCDTSWLNLIVDLPEKGFAISGKKIMPHNGQAFEEFFPNGVPLGIKGWLRERIATDKLDLSLLEGRISAFEFPDYFERCFEPSEEELQAYFQKSPIGCFYSLKEVIDTSTRGSQKIDKDCRDTEVLEKQALNFWSGVANQKGKSLKAQEFSSFRLMVCDQLKRLVLFLAKEVSLIEGLKGNGKSAYFKGIASSIAYWQLRDYLDPLSILDRKFIKHEQAIDKVRRNIELMELPTEVKNAFGANIWKLAAADVAKDINWPKNLGRKKGSKDKRQRNIA